MANFFHLLRNSNLFCNCITETDSVLTNSNRMIKKEKQIERNKKRESIVPASNLERLRVRILSWTCWQILTVDCFVFLGVSFTDCAKSRPLCMSFTDGFGYFFWMQLPKLKN